MLTLRQENFLSGKYILYLLSISSAYGEYSVYRRYVEQPGSIHPSSCCDAANGAIESDQAIIQICHPTPCFP